VRLRAVAAHHGARVPRAFAPVAAIARASKATGRRFRPSRPARFAVALVALVAAAPAVAGAEETSWGVQLLVGGPLNVRTPLTIRQDGEPELRVSRARWRTEPFRSPLYYAIGVFRRDGAREWALELLHQKLFLVNRPPEVERFSVSHGFNLVTVSRGFRQADGVWARLSAGAVVAHPESTVRGRAYPQDRGLLGRGYHLSGATIGVGVQGRLPAGTTFQGVAEARVTASYAVVPVAGGRARVPSVSLHLLAGGGGETAPSGD
jgi:hypothetical protein